MLHVLYVEKYARNHRTALFIAISNLLEREAAHVGMILNGCFKWILETLELTTIVTGGSYKIIPVLQ